MTRCRTVAGGARDAKLTMQGPASAGLASLLRRGVISANSVTQDGGNVLTCFSVLIRPPFSSLHVYVLVTAAMIDHGRLPPGLCSARNRFRHVSEHFARRRGRNDMIAARDPNGT